MEYDYAYLCENLGHLSGLQVRMYKSDRLAHSYANLTFTPDPATLVLDKIWQSSYNVSYFDILNLVFVGAIRVAKDDITIVVGPTSQLQLDEMQLTAILRQLGQPNKRLPELEGYFQSVPPYPLENFLHILCFVNYALNDEKLTVRDLIRQETSYLRLSPKSPQREAPNTPQSRYTIRWRWKSFSTPTSRPGGRIS